MASGREPSGSGGSRRAGHVVINDRLVPLQVDMHIYDTRQLDQRPWSHGRTQASQD